jgi:hypothetical protein
LRFNEEDPLAPQRKPAYESGLLNPAQRVLVRRGSKNPGRFAFGVQMTRERRNRFRKKPLPAH